MKAFKRIIQHDGCLESTIPVSSETRAFINQIGLSLFARESEISEYDLNTLVAFSVDVFQEEMDGRPTHLSHAAYIEQSGGVANLLEDVLEFLEDWPAVSHTLQQQFDWSPERRMVLVMYAFALHQVDRFLEHKACGDLNDAIDALSIAASVAVKANYYAGFESPVLDGFALDRRAADEKITEADEKMREAGEKIREASEKIREADANIHSAKAESAKSIAQYHVERARNSAHARWEKTRKERKEKVEKLRAIFATGKYSSRERCAEEECAALDMKLSAAIKALRNTPDPHKPSSD
jgi:hypothetical protein